MIQVVSCINSKNKYCKHVISSPSETEVIFYYRSRIGHTRQLLSTKMGVFVDGKRKNAHLVHEKGPKRGRDEETKKRYPKLSISRKYMRCNLLTSNLHYLH